MACSDDVKPTASHENWQRPQLEDASTQIRLLRFLPGTEYNDIRLALEVFELDKAPASNAVSYTWGTEPPRDIVRINGASVAVRPNCHYALWQSHHHFRNSPVWLDAICINQDDLDEKARQVAIMGNIYAVATRVLACIGPADACSDAIRYGLTDIDKVVQDLPDAWYDIMDMNLWNPPLGREATMLLADQFNHFYQRPCFGRVWVIQELFGGRNRTIVLCGTYQLNWDALVDLSMRLEKIFNIWAEPPYPGWTEERISRLESLINIHGDTAFPLRHLLDEISMFDCHDDRDRIFGTLNLINWTRYGKIAPLPDYNISPLQLAFDLMRLINDLDLDVVRRTILALNLQAPDSGLDSGCKIHGRRTFKQNSQTILLLEGIPPLYTVLILYCKMTKVACVSPLKQVATQIPRYSRSRKLCIFPPMSYVM